MYDNNDYTPSLFFLTHIDFCCWDEPLLSTLSSFKTRISKRDILNFIFYTMTSCLGFDVTGMGLGTGMPMMSQAGEPGLPLLLTETRQQNTELRLSVGKMQDKIEQLLEKVCTRLSFVIVLSTLLVTWLLHVFEVSAIPLVDCHYHHIFLVSFHRIISCFMPVLVSSLTKKNLTIVSSLVVGMFRKFNISLQD